MAVSGLTIDIEEGEVFTLLGPNGAGKTTTINMLTTLLKPTSGTASIFGHDVLLNIEAVRRLVSLMPQGSALDPLLSVYNNFRFYAKLEQLDRQTWTAQTEEILRELDLFDKKDNLITSLSGGQFRRTQIGRMLLSHKPLVFLDEPTLGIDIEGKLKVWDLIKKNRRQKGWTIILSTNDMAEAEYLSDRITFLHQGAVRRIGTPEDLKDQISRRAVRIRFRQPLLKTPKSLNGYPVETTRNNTIVVIMSGGNSDVRPVLNAAGHLGEITEVGVDRPSLTDVFRHLQEEPS
jgi:ABC-2 type transport system ATP-binding protein